MDSAIDIYALRQAILRTMKAFIGAPLKSDELKAVSQESAIRFASSELVEEHFSLLGRMGYLEAIPGFGGQYYRISMKGMEQLLPEYKQEPFIWGPRAV